MAVRPRPTLSPNKTRLEQLFRRMGQQDLETLDDYFAQRLGDVIQGGLVNAGMLFGIVPAANIQQLSVRVHNTTGSTLTKGTICWMANYDSGSGLPTAVKANAAFVALMPAAGVVMSDIANGDSGYLLRQGILTGLNTAAWASTAGDRGFVSDTTAGALEPMSGVEATAMIIQHAATALIVHASTGAAYFSFANQPIIANHDHTGTLASVGDQASGGALTNELHDGYSEYVEIADPTTPNANRSRFWLDDDASGASIWKQILDSGRIIQHGYELYVPAKNTSGGTISQGDLVRATGTSSGVVTIALAKADSADVYGTIGVAAASITNGSFGLVLTRGRSPKVTYNTASIAAGRPVFVSSSTAGAIGADFAMVVSPLALPLPIGICLVNSATVGEIYIDCAGSGYVPAHNHSNNTGAGGMLHDSLISTYITWASASDPLAAGSAGDMNEWMSTHGASNLSRHYVKDSGSTKTPLDECLFIIAYNDSGSSMPALTVVTFSNTPHDSGVDRYPNIIVSDADVNNLYSGILPSSIGNASYGRVVVAGLIEDVDTSAWASGDNLFASQTAGALTTTQPAPPAFSAPIARVLVSHATKGKLQMIPVFRIGNLTDTNIAAAAEIAVSKLADGDALALLHTASDGVTVEWLPAGQIAMPATQNPSGGANVWDDYEEGTVVLILASQNTANPTHTYGATDSTVFEYIKNGRQVTLSGQLYITALQAGFTADGSGFFYIKTLPFVNAGYYAGLTHVPLGPITLDANYYVTSIFIQPGSNILLFMESAVNSAGPSFIPVNKLTAGGAFQAVFCLPYHASA